MTFFYRKVHLLALSILGGVFFIAFSGCSDSADSVDGPQELIEKKSTSSGFSPDTPEEELLSEGKRLYESGLYSVAKEAFESLRDGYPNSAFIEFAEIKVADSLFESGEYEQAKQGFEEFVRSRPTSTEAAYALFRAGRSAEEQFTGIGRDPTPLKQAKDLYERVSKEYASSPYANEARRKVISMNGKLRSYEAEVAAFYRRQNRDSAAEKRDALAVVPASETAPLPSASPEIVTASRLTEAEPVPVTAKASAELNGKPEISIPETGIIRVICDESQRRVFLYLKSSLELLPPEVVRNGEDISITIPNGANTTRNESCLGIDNLRIANGSVRWVGVKDVVAMALPNPSRIMIQARD